MSDIQHLTATASRILFAQGVLDSFGHISARDLSNDGTFWMSRSMAPGLVMPNDVYQHDENGDIIGDSDAKTFLERYIHSEIYRARPDVKAIVHSHAVSVIPFSVVPEVPLKPVFHMCSFIGGTPTPYEIADHAGPDSDLLVRTRALGTHLAAHLGDANLVLMRGHGFTVVGSTVEEAVFRAVWTERGAVAQASALAIGTPRYLSEGEAIAATNTNRAQISRGWELWVSELGAMSDK